jgi:archaellum component FlaC
MTQDERIEKIEERVENVEEYLRRVPIPVVDDLFAQFKELRTRVEKLEAGK